MTTTLNNVRALRRALITLALIASGFTGSIAIAQPGGTNAREGSAPKIIEAIGTNGYVVRSTDGGKTWTVVEKEEADRRRTQAARLLSQGDLSGTVGIATSPLGSSITVTYELRRRMAIEITICDAGGAVIFSGDQGVRGDGEHTEVVEISRYAKGVYCCRISAGGATMAVGKFIIDR